MMTYTDCGTHVKSEWMPQAMANGLEWSGVIRPEFKDRFHNPYRRKFRANWLLWYVGALLAIAYRPKWLRTRAQVAKPKVVVGYMGDVNGAGCDPDVP